MYLTFNEINFTYILNIIQHIVLHECVIIMFENILY